MLIANIDKRTIYNRQGFRIKAPISDSSIQIFRFKGPKIQIFRFKGP